ncbi:MAG: protein kinase [Verrucomicrobia bacterium]|nr:protein kinase [Verrucomicrobiota bacterium]
MNATRLCRECGKPLPDGAEADQCPSCLLQWGLGSSPDDSTTVLGEVEPPAPEAAERASSPTQPEASAVHPPTGRLAYFGDYELIEEIARGGMGVVFKARQVSLNRTVAVKLILAAQFAGNDAVRRFKTEAEAAARLRHPNIVGIHEVGEQEGFHYFSMDFIAGRHLGQVIRETSVTPRQAAEWVKTIAEAIHYAHEQGILHRDLKPSNILIDAQGVPHVTDFGLAKQLHGDSEITASGQVLGSPNYMPPEQAMGGRESVDAPRHEDLVAADMSPLHLEGTEGRADSRRLLRVKDRKRGPSAEAPLTPALSPQRGEGESQSAQGSPSAVAAARESAASCPERSLRRSAETPLQRVSRRSDVYGLGAILYHALTGRPPFVGGNAAETLYSVLHDEVHAPRLFSPTIPPDLETICLKCLEKEPHRRYQTAQELAEELGRFLRDEPIHARPVSASEKVWRWCRRKPAVAALAASLVTVFLAGLAGVLTQLHRVQVKNLENRQQLARLNVLSGVQLMQDGDYLKSLLWFAEALRTDAGFAEREEVHRLRITAVLSQCPRLVQVVSHDDQPIAAAAFSPVDDRLATVGADQRACVWDVPTGALLFRTAPFDYLPHHVSFSPDGKHLLVAMLRETGVAVVLDAHSGERVFGPVTHDYTGANNQLLHPGFHPSSRWVLVQSGKRTLALWDLKTGERVGQPLTHPEDIARVDFSPDGSRLWVKTANAGCFAWKPATGEPLDVPFTEAERLRGIRFGRHGELALVGDELHDWRTGKRVGTALRHSLGIDAVAFSPEKLRVATASQDGTARLWDAATGEPLIDPLAHDRAVWFVEFSPDGRRLLTISADNLARVWDADLGTPLTPPLPHAGAAGPCGFSGSGRYVFTMHPKHFVFVWDLHRTNGPPVALRPLQGAAQGDLGVGGREFLGAGEAGLLQVRAFDQGLATSLHPSHLRTAPKNSWFDETGRFVIVEGVMAKVQVWEKETGLPITPQVQSYYTLDDAATKSVRLASLPMAGEDLTRLVELVSGNRLDGSGGWTPLETDEIAARWRELRERYAAWFGPPPNSEAAWHRAEADHAAAALDWWAAAFHWRKLEESKPDDAEAQNRSGFAHRNQAHAVGHTQNSKPKVQIEPGVGIPAGTNQRGYRALRLVPPLRDPRADATMIDLSARYNAPLPVFPGGREVSFAPGVRELGGVRFDVRGSIRLQGTEAAKRGEVLPEAVTGIGIDRLCQRLHFLQRASWAGAEKGRPVATLVFHFANGEQVRQLLESQIHVGDSWSTSPYEPEVAKVVWIGTDRDSNAASSTQRVFKYTWENRHPDWEVSRLDVSSARSKASYSLLAVSVE